MAKKVNKTATSFTIAVSRITDCQIVFDASLHLNTLDTLNACRYILCAYTANTTHKLTTTYSYTLLCPRCALVNVLIYTVVPSPSLLPQWEMIPIVTATDFSITLPLHLSLLLFKSAAHHALNQLIYRHCSSPTPLHLLVRQGLPLYTTQAQGRGTLKSYTTALKQKLQHSVILYIDSFSKDQATILSR